MNNLKKLRNVTITEPRQRASYFLVETMTEYMTPSSSKTEVSVVVRDLDGVDMLLELLAEMRTVLPGGLRLHHQANRINKLHGTVPIIAVTNGILGVTNSGFHPNGWLAAIDRSIAGDNVYDYTIPVVTGSSGYFDGKGKLSSIFLNDRQQAQVLQIIDKIEHHLSDYVDDSGSHVLREFSAAGLMGASLHPRFGSGLIREISQLCARELHETGLDTLLGLHHTPAGERDTWCEDTTDVQLVCQSVKALGTLYAVNKAVLAQTGVAYVEQLLQQQNMTWQHLVGFNYGSLQAFAKLAFADIKLNIIAIGDTFSVQHGEVFGSDGLLFGLARTLDENAIIVQPDSMAIAGKGYFRQTCFGKGRVTAPMDHPYCPNVLVRTVPLMANIFDMVADRLISV